MHRSPSFLVLVATAASACGASDDNSGNHLGQPDAARLPDAAPVCIDAGTSGSRIQIELDGTNAEWVKSLRWVDSAQTLTDNLATSGGGSACSSPRELFGQLYGAPEGNQPYLVGGNTLATATQCAGSDLTIRSAALTCDQPPLAQIPITTVYHFEGGDRASTVRITRTIGFDAATPVYPGVGIRPYVPRVPVGTFTTVIYPNSAGTAITSTGTCGGDCFIQPGTTWSGSWFADVAPATGLAMIVLRDPSLTSAAEMTVNNDSSSGSNLSSFVLLQPAGGWKAPITEIEYLCFADLTSWPQAMRDAATLPPGCAP